MLDLGGVIPPSSSSERGGRGSWEHLLRLSLQLANCWGVFGSEEVEAAAGADLDAISSHGSEAPPVPVQTSHRGRFLLQRGASPPHGEANWILEARILTS